MNGVMQKVPVTHNKQFYGSASPRNDCGWPTAILSAIAARRDLRLNMGVMRLVLTRRQREGI